MSNPVGTLRDKTKQLISELRKFLNPAKPTTIRFALYRLISLGTTYIRSTKDYSKLSAQITNARIRHELGLDYGLEDACFLDHKREVRVGPTYADLNDFISAVKNSYSRDHWQDQKAQVLIFCEKATAADVVQQVTDEYDVPLFVSSGYFSRSFLVKAADYIKQALNQSKPTVIGYIGDFDPRGLDIERATRSGNGEVGGNRKEGILDILQNNTYQVENPERIILWERIAVTEEQFINLPDDLKVSVKDIKHGEDGEVIAKGDNIAPAYIEKYGDRCAEVEALEQDFLLDQVREFIETHLDQKRWDRSKKKESSERRKLATIKL